MFRGERSVWSFPKVARFLLFARAFYRHIVSIISLIGVVKRVLHCISLALIPTRGCSRRAVKRRTTGRLLAQQERKAGKFFKLKSFGWINEGSWTQLLSNVEIKIWKARLNGVKWTSMLERRMDEAVEREKDDFRHRNTAACSRTVPSSTISRNPTKKQLLYIHLAIY